MWARPEAQAPQHFTLTSPAFAHGGPIPARFRGRLVAADLSPALEWTPPPEGTVELLLVVEDADAPSATAPIHALSASIAPSAGGIPERGLAKTATGLLHGRGALGHRGWAGPMPVPSHGPHTYAFQLYAIDRALDLRQGFRLADALAAIDGHVIGRARLDGSYEVP